MNYYIVELLFDYPKSIKGKVINYDREYDCDNEFSPRGAMQWKMEAILGKRIRNSGMEGKHEYSMSGCGGSDGPYWIFRSPHDSDKIRIAINAQVKNTPYNIRCGNIHTIDENRTPFGKYNPLTKGEFATKKEMMDFWFGKEYLRYKHKLMIKWNKKRSK